MPNILKQIKVVLDADIERGFAKSSDFLCLSASKNLGRSMKELRSVNMYRRQRLR